MSNDKTTLANVQPGGRVRLGGAIPSPLFDLREAAQHVLHCADCGGDYNCGRPMIDALTTLGIMKKTGRGLWSVNARAAQAVVDALSAQPSPGGQGDASHYWPEVDRILVDAYVAGSEGDEFDMIAARTAIHAALAARQPVGEPDEPIFQVKHHDDTEATWRDATEAAYEMQPAALRRIVYTAPPAQVVDLGRFRKLASWVANCAGHGINDAQRRMGEELLALIDSQGAR